MPTNSYDLRASAATAPSISPHRHQLRELSDSGVEVRALLTKAGGSIADRATRRHAAQYSGKSIAAAGESRRVDVIGDPFAGLPTIANSLAINASTKRRSPIRPQHVRQYRRSALYGPLRRWTSRSSRDADHGRVRQGLCEIFNLTNRTNYSSQTLRTFEQLRTGRRHVAVGAGPGWEPLAARLKLVFDPGASQTGTLVSLGVFQVAGGPIEQVNRRVFGGTLLPGQ